MITTSGNNSVFTSNGIAVPVGVTLADNVLADDLYVSGKLTLTASLPFTAGRQC